MKKQIAKKAPAVETQVIEQNEVGNLNDVIGAEDASNSEPTEYAPVSNPSEPLEPAEVDFNPSLQATIEANEATQSAITAPKFQPKDLAEAQDMAEKNGIDFVGKDLGELTILLNGGKLKKAPVKVKRLLDIPANTDPIVRAAIEKAEAEIALAKSKVAEQNEKLAAQRKAAKLAYETALSAEKAALKEIKEKEDAALKMLNAEKEARRGENEQILAAMKAALPNLEAAFNKAKGEYEDAKSKIKDAEKALDIKQPKAARASNIEKDLNRYVVGQTYAIKNNAGVEVQATVKQIFKGSRSENLYYKFKEVESGNTFKRRAYGEETNTTPATATEGGGATS